MPDPEPNTAATATPANQPAETPANTQPTNQPEKPTVSEPANTQPPSDGAARGEQGTSLDGRSTPPGDSSEPPDILDLAKTDEARATEAAQKAKSDFDAYAKAAGFADGITDAVLQKGENGAPDVTMPAAEVGAMLQALKATGIEADKAKPMLGMVAALDRFRADAAAQEERTILRNLRAEAAQEFGDGLAAAARDMVSGGVALFGAELWRDLSENALPLLNDKRFIRAMASYGARLRNDNGGPASASRGGGSGAMRFNLESWAKGSGG